MNIAPVNLGDRKQGFQYISSKAAPLLIFPQDTKDVEPALIGVS